MTTYEEIRACAVKNRAFWTERALLCLTCYRMHKRDGMDAAAKLERSGFRSNMRDRRNRTYFEGAA